MRQIKNALALLLTMGPAMAQDIGIQFDQMQPCTRWTTENIDDQSRREETYLGREGDFYITEYIGTKPSGEQRFVFKRYYDTQGRLVRAERDGAAMTVLPFSCRYAVGKCTHNSKVPYVYGPSNDRFSEKTLHHENRLEGRVFYFGTVLSNGSVREYPFELGKYNLRVGQEYENNLGQKRGFKLVEIVEP